MPDADAKAIYEGQTVRTTSLNFRCEPSILDVNRVTGYRLPCKIVPYVCGLKITT
jgi:hypothetical protein